MTLREKIANWISGGAISDAVACAERANKLSARASILMEGACVHIDENQRLRSYFRQIAALETPNMAHVGKKAVKLAKEGLGK